MPIPEPVVQGYNQSDEDYVKYLEEFAEDVEKQMTFQAICIIGVVGLFSVSSIIFLFYKILTL